MNTKNPNQEYFEIAEVLERAGEVKIAKVARQIGEGKDFEDRLEIVEVEGDPKVGVVKYIRQLHRHAITDQGSPAVDAHRRRIFEELFAQKPKHVFYEGLPSSVKNIHDFLEYQGMDLDDPMTQEMLMVAQLLFGETENLELSDLPPEFLAKRKVLLDEWGPAVAYGLGAYPEVDLHGSETEETLRAIELMAQNAQFLEDRQVAELLGPDQVQGVQAKIDANEEAIEKIQAKREAAYTQVIMEFLEANPGAAITLVFGGGHEFKDEMDKVENPPVLKTVSYPKLHADWVRELVEEE